MVSATRWTFDSVVRRISPSCKELTMSYVDLTPEQRAAMLKALGQGLQG